LTRGREVSEDKKEAGKPSGHEQRSGSGGTPITGEAEVKRVREEQEDLFQGGPGRDTATAEGCGEPDKYRYETKSADGGAGASGQGGRAKRND